VDEIARKLSSAIPAALRLGHYDRYRKRGRHG
jgi:hypothetical protein